MYLPSGEKRMPSETLGEGPDPLRDPQGVVEQQHLGHHIAVQAVEVEAIDSIFRVEVRYSTLSDAQPRTASFALPRGGE